MTFTPTPPPVPTPPPGAVVTDSDGDKVLFNASSFGNRLKVSLGLTAPTRHSAEGNQYVNVTKDDARALGEWLIEWANS